MFPFSQAEHRQPEPSSADISSFSFAEYGGAYRRELPGYVLRDFDAYVQEVLEICKTHGVKHPKELVLVTNPEPSFETLSRVQFLVDHILFIIQNKELPPESMEEQSYELPVPSDVRVDALDLGGTFVAVFSHTRKEDIVNHQGKIIDSFPLHAAVQDLKNIGGRAGYSVYRPLRGEPHAHSFHYNGQILGNPEGYSAGYLYAIGGKPLLLAQSPGEKMKVLRVDGSLVGKEDGYEEIRQHQLFDVKGKFFFFWRSKHGKMHLNLDGEEKGDVQGYDNVLCSFLADTREDHIIAPLVSPTMTACVAQAQNGLWYPLRFNGEPFGDPEGYEKVYIDFYCNYRHYLATKGENQWCIGENGTVYKNYQELAAAFKTTSVKESLHQDADSENWIMQKGEKTFSVDESYFVTSPPDVHVFWMRDAPIHAMKVGKYYYVNHGKTKLLGPFANLFALRPIDDDHFSLLALEGKVGADRLEDEKRTLVKKVIDLDVLLAEKEAAADVL